MTEAIDLVRRAEGAAVTGELPSQALQPGALTMFEDGDVVFAGNDVHSPADVCARVLALEAKRLPELSPFADAREAHVFAARHNLVKHNRHLPTQHPEEAVPAGQQFFARGGDDLKALLAPFKNNLGALRQMVAEMGSGMGGASKTTGQGVYSQGLGIPLAGEPEPVPGPADKKPSAT